MMLPSICLRNKGEKYHCSTPTGAVSAHAFGAQVGSRARPRGPGADVELLLTFRGPRGKGSLEEARRLRSKKAEL